jgi:hypothetical protein
MNDKKYQRPICRGCYELGTACGKCDKCKDELATLAALKKEPAKILVDYSPSVLRTNFLIGQINAAAGDVEPQALATEIASNIAALAFVLHSMNDPQTVKEIFEPLINQAGAQFAERKRQLENQKKPVFKL